MSEKIDWRKEYSEDEVEGAFAEAFEKPAKYNDVSTWEALVEWEGDDLTVVMEVTSMAGDPTRGQFEGNDALTAVNVRLFDGVEVLFKAREVLTINGTDYRAIYIPVDEDEIEDDVDDEEDIEDDVLEDEEDEDEDEDEDVEDADDLTGNIGWDDIGE